MLQYVNKEEIEVKTTKEYDERDSVAYYQSFMQEIPWKHKILLNRPSKVILVVFALAVVLPPVLFLLFNSYTDLPEDGYSIGTCAHRNQHRVPCGVGITTEDECPTNCCYDYDREQCYHRLPSRYNYIEYLDSKESIFVPRFLETPYKTSSLQRLKLRISDISADHLNIIIYDDSVHTFDEPEMFLESKNYNYKIYTPELFINVFATSGNREDAVLSTSRGSLIASENIWEWSAMLSDSFLYGFDHLPIVNGRKKIFYNNQKDKTSLPIIIAHNNGSFHALLIEHSGPMELNVLESNLVVIKTILGQSISLHLFMGPRPSDVLKQITNYLGHNIEMDYWMLGAHYCRSNMTNSVEDAIQLEEIFRSEMQASEIPYESDCIDGDLVSMLNSPALSSHMDLIRDTVSRLKEDSKRFLASITPYILADRNNSIYQKASLSNLMVMEPKLNSNANNHSKPYLGLIDDIEVAYLDYYSPDMVDFIQANWALENLTDGLYLRNNWPLNNGLNEEHGTYTFPYFTDKFYEAFEATLPWNAIHPAIIDTSNLHMAHHNLYGKAQSDAMWETLQRVNTSNSHLLLTSSTFLRDRSIYAQQEVTSTWAEFKESFVSAAVASLLGTTQAPPVCGDMHNFNNVTQEHLCLQWYLASTFLPVLRIHSNYADRDPLVFTGHARNAMLNAIRTRYKLLPYYYSTIVNSEPLLRPMLYDFYEDERFLGTDDQFMVGEALMIVPNFLPLQITVSALLPLNEIWYDFWDGQFVNGTEDGFIIAPTADTDITVFVRGGFIIPMHETVYGTADETRRRSNYSLIIALNCAEECQARGHIRVSKKEYIKITATDFNVTLSLHSEITGPSVCDDKNETGKSISTTVNSVKVFGLEDNLNNYDFFYHITGLNVDICSASDRELVIDFNDFSDSLQNYK